MRKKSDKKLGLPQILFQILNTIIVVAILSIYGYRFVKYYQYFEKRAHPNIGQQLKEVLINSIDIASSEGLFENSDGTYTYVGNTEKNYVYYSGNYYRIIGINEDGNITLVSTNTIFNSQFNDGNNFVETASYQKIYNDYFMRLNNPTYYLNYCANYNELVDDITKLSSELIEQDIFIRPLTLQEYQAARGSKSFLNTSESFWLENYDSNGYHYYVDDEGNVSIAEITTFRLPFKVVFSINGGVTYVSGNGSKESPYMFTNEQKASKLGECYINQYVKLGNYTFVVTTVDSEKVRLTLTSPLQIDGEDVVLAFGSRNKYAESDIYEYLCENVLPTIPNYEDILMKKSFNYSVIDDASNIIYTNNVYKTKDCYIGLVDVSDIFISNDDVLTMTVVEGKDRSVVVSKENTYFENLSRSEHKVQFVLYIKAEVEIGSGDGSIANPFVVK